MGFSALPLTVTPTPSSASSLASCNPKNESFIGDGTNGTSPHTAYQLVTFSYEDLGNSNCSWSIPSGVTTLSVLMVAGGGGGGGGALSGYYSGGAGGSGVVIVAYPSSNADAVTVSGATKTTSGGNTIYTFTTSGSIKW